jgi:hypothetical protein
MEVWEGDKGRKVYGARKIWLELNSRGIAVARCTVERLMRELGIRGVSPGRKRPPTTLPGDPADRPSDLLERCFDAAAPNRRWVADITYVRTFSGWVYTALSWICSRAAFSDGRSLTTCTPIWRSTRWKWRCGRDGTRTSAAWSIIPTVAFNIRLSVTRSGFQKRGLSGRSGVKVTHMTMLVPATVIRLTWK